MKDIMNATISIPGIDVQIDIINKIETIKNIDEKIAQAQAQVEDFRRAYYSMLFGKK